MNYDSNNIFLEIPHFSVASLQVSLHIWIDPMVGCQDQNHGIYLKLDGIQLRFKQRNMPFAPSSGFRLLRLSTTILPAIFCYVAFFAI